MPLAKMVGAIPKLTPDQEQFKQQLLQLREGIDPTISPDTNIVGKAFQKTARMTVPMVQSIGLGRGARAAAGALGAGKKVAAAATAIGVSGSFLPQIADNTYSSLVAEGVDPTIAGWTTAVSAPIEAAIESILPDPFKTGAFKGTVRQIVGQIAREWITRYGMELSEEALQGASRAAASEVARHLDATVPTKGIGSVFTER